ncbi:lysylphosphatidylglycerol synthase transmembrane domain-containing protein [Paenibacillus sp. R14(2021)]|uniref:lysylphosphatidylglycerol synthase transmembrane domain-containing protein n=1 Tax=Paenibacillus sp. R14(2021) TaxID=2859228 RepID=UPI001C614091|nr:lysylphosphatidylglycerol synthase transmembrane domain-containing protein [Paenibacillus sp. R14(2021)]
MRKIGVTLGGLVLAALFVWFTVRWFHGKLIGEAAMQLLHAPVSLMLMTIGYGLSFWLKALSWRLYAGREKQDPLSRYIHPLFVSLLINHLLPVKAGDLARTGLVVRSTSMRWDDALHSVAAMRVLDMASLLLIGSAGAFVLGIEASPWYLALLAAGVLVAALGWLGLEQLRKQQAAGAKNRGALGFVLHHYEHLRLTLASGKGTIAALLTLACWLLEGSVVYGVTRALGMPINPLEAIWVTGMTIAGQIFHITPGGIGTYETTLTASLGILGAAGSTAYTAALLSHGFKFVFAYVTGTVSIVMSAVTWAELRSWLRLGKREGIRK